MDMSGMSMSSLIAMGTTTSMDMAGMVSSAPTASSTASMDMGGAMDMDMGMGSCKISMMWNWNTIDACFISESWHITSNGMFAGSCIGVILLVMVLELLRRLAREHDRMILAHHRRLVASTTNENPANECACPTTVSTSKAASTATASALATGIKTRAFKPTLPQQMVRALLHCLQFAVAYFIMLLAMYYNGYLIICIFIGAYLGFFVFGWEKLGGDSEKSHDEATVCCG
ncbi:Ctr-domain-containing protein [Aureobasidium pullulans]|uniref:Copper transport protein n=1 Tax=Aureobasidium pullulans TaxID=5580 RepID=A0A4V4KU55_AURPU|nr:Ctr-domain-containing protein [Aureobasidium pullulans]THZ46631.1 Ctr-domain-containing protein [Aureobasidium pullulans]THZ56561.1 Ctr-domain-containing protein [Aureobasidium pullulans]THZ90194.1 Ctr-domain-containing protein [Aureobasidium pullulans]